jgi:hypothetical protein
MVREFSVVIEQDEEGFFVASIPGLWVVIRRPSRLMF